MIVCIDPNISPKGGTGIAWFGTDGVLRKASLLRPPAVKDLAERVRQTTCRLFGASDDVALCIVEWPQIYEGAAENPNHLLGLTAMAMAIVTRLNPAECLSVLPREWKGTINADVMTKRIEGRLSVEELARVDPCPASLLHNIYDAVGIGLWYFKRLERKRVIRR